MSLPLSSSLRFWLPLLMLTWLAHVAGAATPPPVPLPQGPGYFFTIDLDARYQIIGTGALTEEAAATANCYRLTYNNDGKLKQIEYRRAGAAMPDPLFGVASIDFEYQPGLERRTYRDAEGKAMRNADGVAGEELKLNPAGFPVQVSNLDEAGTPTRDSSGVLRYVRTLDDRGRLVRGQRIGLLGTAITDGDGLFETRTVYDDQNRPIERGNYDAAGNLLNNNDGVALIRSATTIYPDSTLYVESYFDSAEQIAVDKTSGVHELQRVVDKRGLLLSESYFDTIGAPCLDTPGGIHERRYDYDERGNELSENFFDNDGKPKDKKVSGVARIVYKYDDKNRVIERDFFGDDGKPQIVPTVGAAIIRQDYDAKGSVIRREFFDGLGQPTPSAIYGAPVIGIEVDGDRTIVRLFDAKGHLMVHPIGGYAAFSYVTDKDVPLSIHNHYYNLRGRSLSYFPRVSVINPHLHALAQPENRVMQYSARLGAGAAGLGALLACWLALRKSSHTKRRKVYVPTPFERLLGWFAIFAIFEGTLRFYITVYWWWLDHQDGRMGHGIYYLEAVFILFFLCRLLRLRVTMRVLNIEREDMHNLVRNFFAKINLKPEWVEARRTYLTPPLDVRVNFFQGKYHAYLAFRRRHPEGRSLALALAQYIRAQTGGIQAPLRSKAIAFYYPSVAFCYFLLSATGFYTLWQLLK